MDTNKILVWICTTIVISCVTVQTHLQRYRPTCTLRCPGGYTCKLTYMRTGAYFQQCVAVFPSFTSVLSPHRPQNTTPQDERRDESSSERLLSPAERQTRAKIRQAIKNMDWAQLLLMRRSERPVNITANTNETLPTGPIATNNTATSEAQDAGTGSCFQCTDSSMCTVPGEHCFESFSCGGILVCQRL